MNRAVPVALPHIDRDHEELFQRLAELKAALGAGDGEAATATLAFVRELAHDHFGREEEVMLACAYPLYREHRSAHTDLWRELAALDAEAAGPAPGPVAERLVALLTRWFEEHVLERDQALQRYVAARAALERRAGAGPARALRFLAR